MSPTRQPRARAASNRIAAAADAKAKPAPKKGAPSKKRTHDARPDTVDFRDQLFVATLVEVPVARPLEEYLSRYRKATGKAVPILDQGQEGACTGFGLAAVCDYLLGTRRQLAPVWKAWDVGVVVDKNRLTTGHSDIVYGVTAAGRLAVVYPPNFTPGQIVHDVPVLARG